MSDSSSNDHWKELAGLIGAEVPDEPIEPEQEAEPEAPPEETAEEEPVAEESTEPPPEKEPSVEPEPAPVAKESPPTNHWWSLAGELGLELPEPEPEPELDPEPEPEPVQVQEPEPEQKPVAEPTLESPVDEADQSPTTEEFTLDWGTDAVETVKEELEAEPALEFPADEADQSATVDDFMLDWGTDAAETPEVESSTVEEESPQQPDPPEDDRHMPLFEDPGLSLEAPGVLDAIFEEADAEAAEDDSEEPIVSFEAEDEEQQADEEAEEAEPVADIAEDEVAAEAEQDSEEKRGKRRKRRRRRRPARKDRDESSETAEESDGKAETTATDDRPTESRKGPREEPSEDADKTEEAKLKHRRIPTWEEAIDIVISANKETRSKSSGGGSRGRRRGRKKPQ